MYGIVLMAAMTGGVEAPEFGRRCSGCSSCSSCSSCWSCSSCSSCSSCKGTRVRRSKCSGCSSCWSCSGSCHVSYSSCYSSCYGSCHSYGCHTSYGTCHGYGCTMSYGTCHGYGCATSYGCTMAAPVIEHAAPPAKPEGGKTIETPKGAEANVAAPARIIVSLPADAKLMVDGTPTTSTTANRVFESPTLPAGKAFSYELKAEYNRDGKPVVVAKNVKISAGATVNVSLFETAAVASR